jgi:hypothetical protein
LAARRNLKEPERWSAKLRRFSLFLLLSGLLVAATSAGTTRAQSFDYVPWQRVLKKSVTDAGRVDYGALKSDPAELNRFTDEIAASSPISSPQDFPTRQDQMAYWINAYNALVIKGVVENWPVESVLKIGTLPHSFFWHKTFLVGGKATTLDNIEKGELRKTFGDPRIHFALVCASNSCPQLQREVFVPEKLDQQLDAAASAFINSPRGMQVEAAANRVTLSKIFDWYSGDFEAYVRAKSLTGGGPTVLHFIRRYANDANRRALDSLHNPRIEFFPYDWGINGVHSRAQ